MDDFDFDFDFDKRYHLHTYEHRTYKSGTLVYVDPAIRNVHCQSPLAGQYVEACEGTYPYSDDPLIQASIEARERKRSHATKVPVRLGGQIRFVEEEYVKRADEVA